MKSDRGNLGGKKELSEKSMKFGVGMDANYERKRKKPEKGNEI